MTCEEARQGLYKYALELCGEDEHTAIRDHIDKCKACSGELKLVRDRLAVLGEWKDVQPSNGLSDRILRRAYRNRELTRAASIILMLAVVIVPLLVVGIRIAEYKQERLLIARTSQALHRYRLDHGEFPPGGTPLGPYLVPAGPTPYLPRRYHDRISPEGTIKDRWGNPFAYIQPGNYNPRLFDLYSFGRDRRDDGGHADDIKNWDWPE